VTLLRQGVGLGDPQRSLPTPTILWFCDSVIPSAPKTSRRSRLVGFLLGWDPKPHHLRFLSKWIVTPPWVGCGPAANWFILDPVLPLALVPLLWKQHFSTQDAAWSAAAAIRGMPQIITSTKNQAWDGKSPTGPAPARCPGDAAAPQGTGEHPSPRGAWVRHGDVRHGTRRTPRQQEPPGAVIWANLGCDR